ncbi:multidrug effflux MFS transporter, partial [Nocardioides sp.]|uniref:multidrug effflux MFS transporter n=1 Tax=Nocardioides sp. TaxID=35761 RepID=UPI00273377F1
MTSVPVEAAAVGLDGREETDPAPRRRHGRGLLLVLAGLTAIGPAMSDMYLAAFPLMADGFGVGASTLQMTLTASLAGLAVGQLLLGPLSDRYGRRRPLMVGMVLFVAASVLCALAPTIEWLIVGRVLQGLAGSAGVVISRAIVRDLYSGAEFVRFFAKLMLVFGLAPVLAPLIGAVILKFAGWESIFFALAGFAVLLLIGVGGLVDETLPPELRSSGGVLGALRLMRVAVRDSRFVLFSLGNSFAFAAMFAYIGAFSFVVQEVFGKSELTFAVLFGVNAGGFVLAGQIAGRLADRVRPQRMVLAG